ITGQVARPFIGKDAFQEIDITGITVPITKHNYLVLRADEIAHSVKEAFHIARTGRPGPVLLDIPRDVFIEEATFSYPDKVEIRGYKPTVRGHAIQIKKAAKLIAESKRPVILAGRGVLISRAHEEIKELAEKLQIPVITTLLGVSCFPEDHDLSLGMIGMHGTAYANLAIDASDLVIAIGMRFDDRATGKVSGFAPHAQIIHIDIDPAEIGKNVRVTVPIVGEVKNVLKSLNKQLEVTTHLEWIEQVGEWRREHPLLVDHEGDKIPPQFVVSKICEVTKSNAIIVTGVGQNQMWSAQHFCYRKPNSLVSSGGLGTMGFELPAAIGAKVGQPDETVWAISGDGGFQMTIQELATAVQDNIGVKIAILNNGFLGMVRQWQELFYDRKYVATPLSSPDFVKVAEAYGMPGIRVTDRTKVVPAIRKAMKHDGPFLIDFVVEPEENVYPMVAPGSSLADILDDPRKKVKIKVQPRATSNL
ncbi:MAG: biosynthetic-type acetolactate synthase large subunit, partial [Dehalococcoidia bacterium]